MDKGTIQPSVAPEDVRRKSAKRYSRLAIKCYATIVGVPIISFCIVFLYTKDMGLGALPIVALLLLGNATVIFSTLLVLLFGSIFYLTDKHSKGVWHIVAIISAIFYVVTASGLLWYIIRLLSGQY